MSLDAWVMLAGPALVLGGFVFLLRQVVLTWRIAGIFVPWLRFAVRGCDLLWLVVAPALVATGLIVAQQQSGQEAVAISVGSCWVAYLLSRLPFFALVRRWERNAGLFSTPPSPFARHQRGRRRGRKSVRQPMPWTAGPFSA